MSNLLFFADFTKAGVGTSPDAAPTVSIYGVNRSTGAEASVVSGGACTASALAGRYFYRLGTADLQTYDYHARFNTTDTTVDAADIPSLWTRWSEAIATDADGKAAATVASGDDADAASVKATLEGLTDFTATSPGATALTPGRLRPGPRDLAGRESDLHHRRDGRSRPGRHRHRLGHVHGRPDGRGRLVGRGDADRHRDLLPAAPRRRGRLGPHGGRHPRRDRRHLDPAGGPPGRGGGRHQQRQAGLQAGRRRPQRPDRVQRLELPADGPGAGRGGHRQTVRGAGLRAAGHDHVHRPGDRRLRHPGGRHRGATSPATP
jgi:hypothetical protein